MSTSQHINPMALKEMAQTMYNPSTENPTKSKRSSKGKVSRKRRNLSNNSLTSVKSTQSLNKDPVRKQNITDNSRLFNYFTKGKYYKKADVYDQGPMDKSHYVKIYPFT